LAIELRVEDHRHGVPDRLEVMTAAPRKTRTQHADHSKALQMCKVQGRSWP